MSETVSAEQCAARVEAAFERIHREQMAGLPLLNNELAVASVGFQTFAGRVAGVVVTPWMMSLILFPGADDAWEGLALGAKESFPFPGGVYRFMSNTIDGLGTVMMYSVHSPMRAFPNQESALAEASGFVERAMTPATQTGAEASAEDPVNEELLGRILRGEHVPEVDAAVASLPATGTPALA
jgi:[NiFe] hydrogenase assembly HybE family chaperone